MPHTLVRNYSVCSSGGGGAISSLHRTISGYTLDNAPGYCLPLDPGWPRGKAQVHRRGLPWPASLPTNLPLTILRRQHLLPPILPPGLLQLDLTQQETSIGRPTADQILSLKILALRPPESI